MKIFDSDFLKKLDRIALNSKMIMTDGLGGGRRSKSKGSSVEFSDFREYTPGDDFRRIDWNAYGRFDRLFVKLFIEEREAFVNIFIDCSKSMDFGNSKKATAALRLSGVLSYLTLGNMDRLCINEMKDGVLKQSPSLTGRASFNRCIGFLEEREFSGSTNLAQCIKQKLFGGKGISIIISDFFSSGEMEEWMKYLNYKKQEIILIHLLSEEESNPSFDGQVKLVDSETGNFRDIAITQDIMKKYENELEKFLISIKEKCNKHGATYIQVSSEEEIEKIVFEDFVKAGII